MSSNVFKITPGNVADELRQKATGIPDGEWIEVLLQVEPIDDEGMVFSLHYNDPFRNQSYPGFCGSGYLGVDTDCFALAQEMLAECQDEWYSLQDRLRYQM